MNTIVKFTNLDETSKTFLKYLIERDIEDLEKNLDKDSEIKILKELKENFDNVEKISENLYFTEILEKIFTKGTSL